MTKEPAQFGFEVQRIIDCGFMIEEAIVPETGDVQIGYGMGFFYDVEASYVNIGIRTDFKTASSNAMFMTGTVATRFWVDNMKGFADKNGVVEFPDGMLPALFSIAFSHMRAIISKNVSGSRFTNIIVPIVNPNELFVELLQRNKKAIDDQLAELEQAETDKALNEIKVTDAEIDAFIEKKAKGAKEKKQKKDSTNS
jgi:hypothetical protein